MAWIIIYTADDSQLYFAFKSVDVDATKWRVENCISALSLDGSQGIEAKPRQDGGRAHPLEVSSLSTLSVLIYINTYTLYLNSHGKTFSQNTLAIVR